MASVIDNFSVSSLLQVDFRKQTLSQTTLKTHALVVSGYLLVTMGIAFAAATLYVSKIASLVTALTIPTLSIAMGTLMITRAKRGPSLSPAPAPFKGIVNRGGNDCCINSFLQFILQIPSLSKRLEEAKKNFSLFSHPLQPLFDAQVLAKRGEEIDSRAIRKWLEDAGVATRTDASQQDDPLWFMNYVFKTMDYQLPTLYEKSVTMKGSHVVNTQETKTSRRNPLRYFDLAFFVDSKRPSLRGAFERYFNEVEELSDEQTKTTVRFMQHPPEEFSVALPQTDPYEATKVVQHINCPLALTLPKAYVGKDADYECDGFMLHMGKRRSSGHYVAAIKDAEGRWWLANDNSVTQIPEKRAEELAKAASVIHYTLVDSL